jgi:hypothetical protein
MFGSPTFGRSPTAALWSATSQIVKSGAGGFRVVELDHKAWDTDNMLIELGDGQKTTKISPQRTGVYTIKAGDRRERRCWTPTAGCGPPSRCRATGLAMPGCSDWLTSRRQAGRCGRWKGRAATGPG